MTILLNLIATFWFLIAGFNGPPKDYDKCEPTAIWHYDGTEEQWYAWFPQFEDPGYLAVPEAYKWMLDWMYADKGYWVACKEKANG